MLYILICSRSWSRHLSKFAFERGAKLAFAFLLLAHDFSLHQNRHLRGKFAFTESATVRICMSFAFTGSFGTPKFEHRRTWESKLEIAFLMIFRAYEYELPKGFLSWSISFGSFFEIFFMFLI